MIIRMIMAQEAICPAKNLEMGEINIGIEE